MVLFETLGPVVPDSICEQVAFSTEFGCSYGVVAVVEALELLFRGLVPEKEGAVPASRGEGIAVKGMELDGVNGEDIVGSSVALEREVFLLHVVFDVGD